MNARLVLVAALLSATGCAAATAQQREDAINAALTSTLSAMAAGFLIGIITIIRLWEHLSRR